MGLRYSEDLFAAREKRLPPRPIPIHEPIQITFDPDPILYAAISPDGEWFVYTSGREGLSTLWIRPADPNRVLLPRPITQEAGNQISPAFSPDGNRIAFVGTGHDVKGDIYVLDLRRQTEAPLRLTGRDTEDGSPCFSPDGQTIFFHQRRTGDTGPSLAFRRLQGDDQRVHVLNGMGAFPALSPDGKTCAFVSYRDDPGGDIALLDLETNQVVQITDGAAMDLFPSWSRDGRSLYFTRFGSDTDKDGALTGRDNGVIHRVRPQSREKRAYP